MQENQQKTGKYTLTLNISVSKLPKQFIYQTNEIYEAMKNTIFLGTQKMLYNYVQISVY